MKVTASVYADGTGSAIASVVLNSIASNEPDNGLGDGDTVNHSGCGSPQRSKPSIRCWPA
ncbi:hypothetical protein [Paenibacillus sp. yr247]|uniref:hypothetical protein n=1 Tax=Paenibacillus sp. yr247 TaxID=1761880 RepID=UPI00114054CB|nr:hypothetical protein [Paenibacillus sp. yr247]